jgi:hypothetical protein
MVLPGMAIGLWLIRDMRERIQQEHAAIEGTMYDI